MLTIGGFILACVVFYLLGRLMDRNVALTGERDYLAHCGKLALGIENAFDTIFITDEEGRILYVNKAFQKNTGYSADDVVGQEPGAVNLWGGMDPTEFYRQAVERLSVIGHVYRGIFKNVKKNGDRYVTETKIVKINEVGEPLFMAIERDVTDSYAREQIQASFISLIAHQIRTPLSVIRWYAELLQAGGFGKPSPKQKDALEKIQDTGKSLASIISTLLSISRIEMGGWRVQFKQLDWHNFFETTVGTFADSAARADIELRFESDKNVALKFFSDETLLRLVVDNLIENALKYTARGGRVVVRCGYTANDGNVQFNVEDTGCGIPAAEKGKVFSKGFRASNAVEISANGTGLGLYLVKNIVELLDGQIVFSAGRFGKGTKFEVILPTPKSATVGAEQGILTELSTD